MTRQILKHRYIHTWYIHRCIQYIEIAREIVSLYQIMCFHHNLKRKTIAHISGLKLSLPSISFPFGTTKSVNAKWEIKKTRVWDVVQQGGSVACITWTHAGVCSCRWKQLLVSRNCFQQPWTANLQVGLIAQADLEATQARVHEVTRMEENHRKLERKLPMIVIVNLWWIRVWVRVQV